MDAARSRTAESLSPGVPGRGGATGTEPRPHPRRRGPGPGHRALDAAQLGPADRRARRAGTRRAARVARAAAAREDPRAGARDPEKSRGLLRSGDRADPLRVFRFIEQEKAHFPVATMCRVLTVSASGYWAWRRRGESSRAGRDRELAQRIKTFHSESHGIYGSPPIHPHLREDGQAISRKRVARWMRQLGLRGVSRRRTFTTHRDPDAVPTADLVKRDFHADAPDRMWVADPHPVGSVGVEVPLDQVGGGDRVRVTVGGEGASPADAPQTQLAHPPGHPLATDRLAVLAQVGVDGWRAVDAVALGVEGLDALREFAVTAGA